MDEITVFPQPIDRLRLEELNSIHSIKSCTTGWLWRRRASGEVVSCIINTMIYITQMLKDD